MQQDVVVKGEVSFGVYLDIKWQLRNVYMLAFDAVRSSHGPEFLHNARE